MRLIGYWAVLMALLALCAEPVAAEEQYKKYVRPSDELVAAELMVSPESWTFSVFIDNRENVYRFTPDEIIQHEGRIKCGDEVELSDEGLKFDGFTIPAEDIKRIDITSGSDPSETILTFISSESTGESSGYKRKKGDRVSFMGDVIVEGDEFIRGSVISFFGKIDVYGEVNEDVVAIFGDVHVASGAVIRGDVIAANGQVELDDKSSVYGVIKSSKGKTATRRHRARRWKEYQSSVSAIGTFYYNRVDGLLLMGGAEYNHADSIIPSFSAMAGYGFASDRWRYTISLTQTVLRGPTPVQVGGELFRLLKSGDDKIISESENSIFALLFNEDWKDYYESEGGYGFARVNFLRYNKFEIGYLSEQQRWIDAHANLWSLFGDKEFRGNFSSVPYDTLVARKAQFDEKQITSLILDYSFDSRDEEKHPNEGWYGYARYEYSPRRWKGDFDFERFEARLKRFQPLGRYVAIDLAGAYGRVIGDEIPLSRLCYLGGLGTIHGYRHKEFIGTEYVLVSGEYSFKIPHSEIAPFVLYDGGRIIDGHITGDNQWSSSIGIGIDFNRSVRVFLSKRLDIGDNDPIFYARFSAVL